MVETIPFDSHDPFGELSDNFLVMRAAAIQSYATLEQSMARCFGYLAGVTDDVAGIIFFRMVNARSRIAVMEKLKRLKHGSSQNLYFNSIMSAAGELDMERNKVIHWTQLGMIHVNDDGAPYTKAKLVPPNIWFGEDGDTALTAPDILEFAYKCDFYARGLNGLTWHWQGVDSPQPWLDIFERRLAYPPAEDHLLTRKRPERPSQPEA